MTYKNLSSFVARAYNAAGVAQVFQRGGFLGRRFSRSWAYVFFYERGNTFAPIGMTQITCEVIALTVEMAAQGTVRAVTYGSHRLRTALQLRSCHYWTSPGAQPDEYQTTALSLQTQIHAHYRQ